MMYKEQYNGFEIKSYTTGPNVIWLGIYRDGIKIRGGWLINGVGYITSVEHQVIMIKRYIDDMLQWGTV